MNHEDPITYRHPRYIDPETENALRILARVFVEGEIPITRPLPDGTELTSIHQLSEFRDQVVPE